MQPLAPSTLTPTLLKQPHAQRGHGGFSPLVTRGRLTTEGRGFLSKETSLCKQAKVFFVENFLGNFEELGLVAAVSRRFTGAQALTVDDNDAGEAIPALE